MNSQRETEQGKWVSLDQQQSRMNEIENMVAGGFMTAPQCFTQMKQLIQAAWQAATEQGVGEPVDFTPRHGFTVEDYLPVSSQIYQYTLRDTITGEPISPLTASQGGRMKLALAHPYLPKPTGGGVPEVEWLKTLEDECWDLRCVAEHNHDDADVAWVVIEHHMDEPKERIIGYGKTPLKALLATQQPPEQE